MPRLVSPHPPLTQRPSSPQLPAIPVPFSSAQPRLKPLSVSILIVQGNEPEPDVNYDPGDNVEDDHRQSFSLNNAAEASNFGR